MIDMTTSLLNNSFLAEFIAIDVDRMESEDSLGTPAANRAVTDSLASGLPSIKQSNDGESDAVALSNPVYKSGSNRSMAVFVGKADVLGVIEIWQPVRFGASDRRSSTTSFLHTQASYAPPALRQSLCRSRSDCRWHRMIFSPRHYSLAPMLRPSHAAMKSGVVVINTTNSSRRPINGSTKH